MGVSIMMRGGRQLTDAAAAIEFLPTSFAEHVSLDALFSHSRAPLEVDLGCGDGSFLAALAAQKPQHNFLGIEQMPGRIRASCRRIDRLKITNARIIRAEITATARDLLPPQSVDRFHLMFPDPWPKRRHHRRRVFTRELLESLDRALKPGGVLHIATDQRDYFEQMEQALNARQLFHEADSDASQDLPQSTFEERFLEANDEIYRLLLRKVSG